MKKLLFLSAIVLLMVSCTTVKKTAVAVSVAPNVTQYPAVVNLDVKDICSKYGSYSYSYSCSIDDANAESNASTVYHDYAKIKRERDVSTPETQIDFPETQIDFVYSLYIVVKDGENKKSTEMPLLDYLGGEGDFLEYIVRFELSQNQIVLKLQTVDRTNGDKRTTFETHYINPSSSSLDISSHLWVAYKENGETKGLVFFPESKHFAITESNKNRIFTPITEPLLISFIEVFNNDKSFDHTIAGETDYEGKFNKLKTILKKYNWKNQSGY